MHKSCTLSAEGSSAKRSGISYHPLTMAPGPKSLVSVTVTSARLPGLNPGNAWEWSTCCGQGVCCDQWHGKLMIGYVVPYKETTINARPDSDDCNEDIRLIAGLVSFWLLRHRLAAARSTGINLYSTAKINYQQSARKIKHSSASLYSTVYTILT